jgi:hypothetical protein
MRCCKEVEEGRGGGVVRGSSLVAKHGGGIRLVASFGSRSSRYSKRGGEWLVAVMEAGCNGGALRAFFGVGGRSTNGHSSQCFWEAVGRSFMGG